MMGPAPVLAFTNTAVRRSRRRRDNLCPDLQQHMKTIGRLHALDPERAAIVMSMASRLLCNADRHDAVVDQTAMLAQLRALSPSGADMVEDLTRDLLHFNRTWPDSEGC